MNGLTVNAHKMIGIRLFTALAVVAVLGIATFALAPRSASAASVPDNCVWPVGKTNNLVCTTVMTWDEVTQTTTSETGATTKEVQSESIDETTDLGTETKACAIGNGKKTQPGYQVANFYSTVTTTTITTTETTPIVYTKTTTTTHHVLTTETTYAGKSTYSKVKGVSRSETTSVSIDVQSWTEYMVNTSADVTVGEPVVWHDGWGACIKS